MMGRWTVSWASTDRCPVEVARFIENQRRRETSVAGTPCERVEDLEASAVHLDREDGTDVQRTLEGRSVEVTEAVQKERGRSSSVIRVEHVEDLEAGAIHLDREDGTSVRGTATDRCSVEVPEAVEDQGHRAEAVTPTPEVVKALEARTIFPDREDDAAVRRPSVGRRSKEVSAAIRNQCRGIALGLLKRMENGIGRPARVHRREWNCCQQGKS